MWTWWRWAATPPARISSTSTAATAAPARRRTSPRRTSPCPSNTPSARCTISWTDEGVRDKVTLIASGGIRTAHDIAKAIALGADGVVIGTAELVALGCVRCSRCESGRGCPRGIATTDPELAAKMDLEWGTQRLINLYNAWRKTLVGILAAPRPAQRQRAAGTHRSADAPGLHQRCGAAKHEQRIDTTAGRIQENDWPKASNYSSPIRKEAEEGGCGVVGFCCSEPVPGRHIYEPSRQMHNRGNGKGGGIAAVGLRPGAARRQPGGARQPLHAACGVPRHEGAAGNREAIHHAVSSTSPPPRSSTRWTTGKRCRAWKC